MMEVVTITPATELPVSLVEAKAHLKVLHASEDVMIGVYLAAATEEIRVRTGRALTVEVVEAHLRRFPVGPICLCRPPFSALQSVTYVDRAGARVTLPLIDIDVATYAVEAWLAPKSGAWPDVTPGHRAVTVRWTAGTAAADVAPTLKAAILLRTADLYMKREPTAGDMRAIDSLVRLNGTTGWI